MPAPSLWNTPAKPSRFGLLDEADPISLPDANAERPVVQNPYAYDNLAISAGSLTPGGRVLGLFGAYPENVHGGMTPSLLKNIRDGHYGSAGMQALGVFTGLKGGDLSGLPNLDRLVNMWVSRRP